MSWASCSSGTCFLAASHTESANGRSSAALGRSKGSVVPAKSTSCEGEGDEGEGGRGERARADQHVYGGSRGGLGWWGSVEGAEEGARDVHRGEGGGG